MTVAQFIDYLAAYPQTEQLAGDLGEIIEEHRRARYQGRRSA